MDSILKIATSLVFAFTCSLPIEAQIAARVDRSPGGLEEIRIRNNSATSVTAFAVYAKQAADRGSAPFVMYFDSLEPETNPLLSNEERLLVGMAPRRRTAGNPFPGVPAVKVFEEPIVTAGIFEDGSTTGDSALLNRLILRRCNMLQAVETALETLLEAGRHNVPRDQLIGQFRNMADSIRRWYLPPEQQVGLRVYQPIIGKLMHLPDGQAGSAFPPNTFVNQETTRLNRQRITLLESHPSLAEAAVISR